MARMFPEQLPDTVRDDRSRRAEVRLYDALAAAAPDDWRVLYSVPWLGRPQANALRDGEADFVIVHPQHGLLVLEVKGGGIERDGSSGQWWSIDANGEAHAISDPFAQAARSKHALLDHLRALPAFRDRWIPIAHAVAFPDLGRIEAPFGPHAPPELVITGNDLARVDERVEELFRFAAPGTAPSFDDRQALEIERALAPTRRVRAPLAVAAREADRALITLTESQYRVLDTVRGLRRVAVSGPAGSGKSLLAAEQARRLAAQGFRTLYVCFNRPLGDVMAGALDGDGLSVHTFHDLCRHFGTEAGLLEAGYVDDAPPEYFERLPEVLLEALQHRPDLRFDAIVVDEGQDFEADWWPLLELAMSDGADGILYVFHDDAQRVSAGESTLPPNLVSIALPSNVRNTLAIHALAERFAPGSKAEPGVPAGQPVEFVEVAAAAALEPVLSKLLHRLNREDQFRPEEIAILSGRGRASSGLTTLERIGAYRCGALPVLPGVVALDTIRRFKGLDSRVVILVEIDSLLEQPELLYVGITRARTHLVVVGSSEVLRALS